MYNWTYILFCHFYYIFDLWSIDLKSNMCLARHRWWGGNRRNNGNKQNISHYVNHNMWLLLSTLVLLRSVKIDRRNSDQRSSSSLFTTIVTTKAPLSLSIFYFLFQGLVISEHLRWFRWPFWTIHPIGHYNKREKKVKLVQFW